MAAKQAINDKLQSSVAACLRCGGGLITKFKKGLLLSLSDFFFKIGEYLAKLQAKTWLSRALRLLAVCWPGTQSAWDNRTVFTVNEVRFRSTSILYPSASRWAESWITHSFYLDFRHRCFWIALFPVQKAKPWLSCCNVIHSAEH